MKSLGNELAAARSWGDRVRIQLFYWVGDWALARFLGRTTKASTVNNHTLQSILRRNRHTEFGRLHSFDALLRDGRRRPDNFRNLVPLSTFADYESYVGRIAAGEQSVLSADRVMHFGGTAGTTDRPKRIPRTRRVQAHHMMLVVLAQQAVVNRGIAGARSAKRGINLMSLYGSPAGKDSVVPVLSGPNAGMARIRKLIPLLWTSPEPAFRVAHQPSALYLHALFGLRDRSALYIETPFAPQVVAWFALIEQHQAQLIDNIRRGTLSEHLVLSIAEQHALGSHLSPDPKRAEEIAEALRGGFEGAIARLWSAMRYIRTVTSGSFGLSLPRLRWLAGPRIVIQSGCHSSSEGVIGINLKTDGSNHYVLAVGTSFFEFIPLSDVDEDQPTTVDIDDLQLGRDYEIVLTSSAGLYRYRLGDIVRITGRQGSAPVFEYRYRRGTILNLVGEKTTEWHTTTALQSALSKGLHVADGLVEYTVSSSVTTGVGQYTFYVELGDAIRPDPDTLETVTALLDDELGIVNEYFRHTARATQRMAPPRIELVKPGTFEAVAKLQLLRGEGLSPSQVKIPRVVNCPEQIALLEHNVIRQ